MAISEYRGRTVALWGCFLMAVSINAYVIAPASLIPIFIDDFSVTKSGAALSITATFAAWFLFQLPAGSLTDRVDNRVLVAIAVGVYASSSFAIGVVVVGYPAFLLLRILGGATAAFLWTTNANIVAQVYPADQRATATGLFLASAPVGLAFAQVAGPPIATAVGWPAVFLLYPVLAILGVALLYAAVRSPIHTSELPARRIRSVLTERSVVLVSISSFCTYSLFMFFNSWMPTFATEVVDIDLSAAGAAASLVAFVGVAARPLGGMLADRFERPKRVVVGAYLLVVPVLGSIAGVESPIVFAALLLLAGFSTQLAIGVFYPFITTLSRPESVGASLAVLTAISVFGSLTAPVLFGYLIQEYSWAMGFAVAGVFVVGGIGILWGVPET